uniref:Ig-like domain-containing protein n=1 Tax=Coturnix japonica TaxID=93934 RepID=A0A8C2U8A9_COTJA
YQGSSQLGICGRLLLVWLGNVLLPGCAVPGSCCFSSAGVCAQFRLEVSGGGVQAAGESVQFFCRGSGLSFDDYFVLWYRQALSGHLEWLSYIVSSSYIRYSPVLEDRASVSLDSSQSVSSLSLRALHPHDSAHYFCAVNTGTGNPAEL